MNLLLKCGDSAVLSATRMLSEKEQIGWLPVSEGKCAGVAPKAKGLPLSSPPPGASSQIDILHGSQGPKEPLLNSI